MNHDHPASAVGIAGAQGDQIERAMRRARHERAMVAKTLFLGVYRRLTGLVADPHPRTGGQPHGTEARP